MRQIYYVLKKREPIPATMMEWGESLERPGRRIGSHKINGRWVSTVFLGMDHQFGADGPPILFETMIFGRGADFYQARCSTYEEAQRMHKHAVLVANGGRVPKAWRRKRQNKSRGK